MLFVNKETEFVNQIAFFLLPKVFLITQVQDDIQEFDYSGNEIPDCSRSF